MPAVSNVITLDTNIFTYIILPSRSMTLSLRANNNKVKDSANISAEAALSTLSVSDSLESPAST